jgi:hypothetical protein
MRILRSRSDHEVSSTGFALFVAGLVIAGFIGGALRTLLSSDQIQARILTELQTALPSVDIKMDTAKVSLARGFWPGISISIPKLRLQKPESCGETAGNLELEGLDLPLDVIALLRSHVHWSVVSVRSLSLNFRRQNCAKKDPEPIAKAETKPGTKESSGELPKEKDLNEQIGKTFDGVEKIGDHISGVHIGHAVVASLDDPTWHLDIDNFDLDFSRKVFLNAKLNFQKTFPGGTIEHAATLKADATKEQFKWELRSPMKEGAILWNGIADREKDSVIQKITIRQLPLKDVLAEFQSWMDSSKGGSPRFIWLSCDLDQTGKLSNFAKLPLTVSDCKIDGEGEQIVVNPGQQIWVWERVPLHEPLVLNVNHLSLQTLFDLFGQKGLPAILPKPGQWTGEIQFTHPKKWQMLGNLEGAEVIFSNQSVRGKQIVSKMKTALREENSQISGELSDVALTDGSADGKIEFKLDPTFRNGDYRVELSSFALSPSVQTLMAGGVATAMALSGHGRIENGDLSVWKGQARWKSMEGQGWRVTEPRLDTEFEGGKFLIHLQMQAADLGADFPYAPFAEKILGGAQGMWRLRDGAAQAAVNKTGGSIKEIRVRGPSGKVLKFQGEWERGGDLSGALDFSGKKYRVHGHDGHLSIEE